MTQRGEELVFHPAGPFGFGVAFGYAASGYEIGTAFRMGPGYFPFLLGIVMIVLGALYLFVETAAHDDEQEEDYGPPQWRGWLAIVSGIIAFIILGRYGGLIPATLALVFISAMGDKEHSWLTALLLSIFVTLLGVVIFSWGLELQFPLFTWG